MFVQLKMEWIESYQELAPMPRKASSQLSVRLIENEAQLLCWRHQLCSLNNTDPI